MTYPSDPTPAEAADYYARLGLRVVPIKRGEKRPPMASWQHAATNDPDKVAKWYRGLYGDAGVGIAPGRLADDAYLFVIDVDEHDPSASGSDTLHELEAELGALPETLVVLTPSGGSHRYYVAPVEIRNDAGTKLGPGIDVRGEGGQVLAPPTVHPNGGRYEWEDGAAPGDRKIARIPEAWLDRLLGRDVVEAVPEKPKTPPAERTVWDELDDRPGIRWSQSVDWKTLLEADGWRYLGRGHAGEDQWQRPGQEERGKVGATTGYGGSDVLKVFTSSVPGLVQDETYTKFGYYAQTRHRGDHAAAAKALRAELAPLGPSTAPDAAPDALGGSPEPENPLTAYEVDWAELWKGDHAVEDWLAEPLLARGRGHALYAGAKSGKSLLVLDVVAALATGRPILGGPARDPIVVGYVDYEMTLADLHERLETFGYHAGDDLSNLRYALLPTIAPLDTKEGGRIVADWAKRIGAELVVIDTASRAVEGDENDADTYRALYMHTGLFLKAAGIAYLRIDHAGKDASKGQRGSSAKNDDVDVVWKLEPSEGGVTVTSTHRRMSWIPERLKVHRREDEHGVTAHVVDRGAGKPFAAGTKEVAALLDELGVPVDVTVSQAVASIRSATGKGKKTALVADAVRYRRARAADQWVEQAGNASGNASETTSGNDDGKRDTDPETSLVRQAGNAPGNVGNEDRGQSGNGRHLQGDGVSQTRPKPKSLLL